MKESNKLKGGKSDNMSIKDIAIKHTYDDSKDSVNKGKIDTMVSKLLKQLKKGIEIEKEHTKTEGQAKEIAMDHLSEDPNYYSKLSKIEEFKESMGAEAAGSFEMSFNSKPIKRPITKIHNMNEDVDIDEAMAADASGAYDVPFPSKKRKDPLSIGGVDSIKKSRAVVDKKFPKWGGPKGVYVKIKEKCKKFPYCNQGNTGALEFFEVDGLVESVQSVSKKYGIPYAEMEKIVLNEIKKIFIR